MANLQGKSVFRCSFCGKSQNEVRKLIAGPVVFICDECTKLCMDIINEEDGIVQEKEPNTDSLVAMATNIAAISRQIIVWENDREALVDTLEKQLNIFEKLIQPEPESLPENHTASVSRLPTKPAPDSGKTE